MLEEFMSTDIGTWDPFVIIVVLIVVKLKAIQLVVKLGKRQLRFELR